MVSHGRLGAIKSSARYVLKTFHDAGKSLAVLTSWILSVTEPCVTNWVFCAWLRPIASCCAQASQIRILRGGGGGGRSHAKSLYIRRLHAITCYDLRTYFEPARTHHFANYRRLLRHRCRTLSYRRTRLAKRSCSAKAIRRLPCCTCK